tara:strand:- start:300 stop:707 length:408 start_codon:yes stop_codon:yes gene_type:complete
MNNLNNSGQNTNQNNMNMDAQTKEDFTNNVKEYIELEEQVSKLNIALRERRTKLKTLSSMIIKNMENNDIHHINIKNGLLVYKNNTMYKGLNQKNLKSGLSIYFNNDEQKTTSAITTVMNNRERINKIKLQLKKF